MSIVGFQDFWVAGSRFYFQRDPIEDVEQPWVDLGVIQSANPTFNIEKLELKDADGGTKVLVDEATNDIAEQYDIVTNNLNQDNLGLLFLANAATDYTQSAAEAVISHWATPGRLFSIKDTVGDYVYHLSTIAGIYTGAVEDKIIESITVSTKIIKLTGDQTAEAGLAAGKAIIVRKLGLVNILNSRSYTVVSAVLNAGKTDVTVNEAPASNETAITGTLTIENGGTIFEQDLDWDPYSLERGFARMLEGGSFAVAAAVTVVYSMAAQSGTRLLLPLSQQGEVKGNAKLFWGRGRNTQQSVREFRASISPSAASIGVDDFSNITLSVKAIVDLTEEVPAGKLIYITGDLPSSS